jgi:hypothetical protein
VSFSAASALRLIETHSASTGADLSDRDKGGVFTSVRLRTAASTALLASSSAGIESVIWLVQIEGGGPRSFREAVCLSPRGCSGPFVLSYAALIILRVLMRALVISSAFEGTILVALEEVEQIAAI